MGQTQGLTDKPIVREVVEEDGRVVAAHLSDVVTDPESADAVQVPDGDTYPSANATQQDPLRVHEAATPADSYDDDETAVNEVQRIDPSGTVSGGTYDFVLLPGTVNEISLAAVPYDATAAEVQVLVNAEPHALDGEGNANVAVSGVAVGSGNLDFTFQNEFGAKNQPELTVDDTDITGGGTLAAATVTAGVHSDG